MKTRGPFVFLGKAEQQHLSSFKDCKCFIFMSGGGPHNILVTATTLAWKLEHLSSPWQINVNLGGVDPDKKETVEAALRRTAQVHPNHPRLRIR
jgi:hypothetical protein